MFFADKLDLISLSFSPRNPCFSKAQIEWRGIVLNGKLAKDKPIVDLSDENLSDLIFELFGDLQFIEVAELYQAISNSDISRQMDWEAYFKNLKLHYNQRTLELFEKINELPSLFKDWAFERKLSSSDLMPLNSLKDLEVFSFLSSLFSELRCTRNEGKKIIDLLVDLILMNKSQKELQPNEGKDWLKSLYEQRYPETEKMDLSRETSSWPDFVQVQNKRNGDKLTYNMQIQYSDATDLTSKLNRLSQMSQR